MDTSAAVFAFLILSFLVGCSSSSKPTTSADSESPGSIEPQDDDSGGGSEGDTTDTTQVAESPATVDVISPTNYISVLTDNIELLSQALRDSPVSELEIDGFAAFPDRSSNVVDATCLDSGSISRTIEIETLDPTTGAMYTTTTYDANNCLGPAGSLDGRYTISDYDEGPTSGYYDINRSFDAKIALVDGTNVSVVGSFGLIWSGSSFWYSFDTTRYQITKDNGFTSIVGQGNVDDYDGTLYLNFDAQVSGVTVVPEDPSVELTVSTRPSDYSYDLEIHESKEVIRGEVVITATDNSAVTARATSESAIADIVLANSSDETTEESRPWIDFLVLRKDKWVEKESLLHAARGS